MPDRRTFRQPAARAPRAASPRAGRHGRPALWWTIKPVCLAAALAAAGPAAALPSGAQVTAGQVQVGTPQGGQLVIRQDTAKAGIDWQGFSIGAGEKVQVQQPNASAVLFNRVVGADPSVILGQLQANGRVFLSNPRGILFGAGSQVSVGGLVATTLDIDPQALANGRYQLTRGLGQPGELRAEGDIQASGTVALVAPTLVQSGTISAARVGLAAAGAVQVDVEGDGLIFFNVRNEDLATRLSLLGSVLADGGSVEARAVARSGFADTVLNMDGIVRARSLGQREGRVVIDGGPAGITQLAGTVDVSGLQPGEQGGQATVLGEKVLLTGTARVDARGDAGGGTVLVGGNWQGKGAEANAQMTAVARGAAIDASAQTQGEGGTVVVWSDQATRYQGQIAARGGAQGGDGGQVEVSGKQYLDFRGSVDLQAPAGLAGSLLLDPTNLTISAGPANINGDATTGDDLTTPTLAFAAGGVNSVITATAVEQQLLTNPVLLQATNNIAVNAAITSSSGRALTLNAGNNIDINQPIRLQSGTADLILLANDTASGGASGTGRVAVNSTLEATGTVSLTRGGGTGAHAFADSNITAGTLLINGSSQLTGTNTWSVAGTSGVVSSLGGTGSLTKQGTGVLSLSGTNTFSGGISAASGELQFSSTAAFPSGSAVNVNGGTLEVGALNLSAGTVTLSSGTINGTGGGSLSGTAFNVQAGNINARLTGSGALTKTGSGTVTITVAQTYSGGTTVNDGTLRVSGTGNLSGGAVSLAGTSTELDIVGATVGNTLTSNGGVLNSSTGGGTYSGTATLSANTTVRSGDATTGLTISGNLGGAGGLVKDGSGGVTLSGTNNYGGSTLVSDGTLRIGSAAALPSGTALTLNGAGATLDLNGNSVTAASLSLTNGTLTGGTLTAGSYAVQAGTLAATLAGSGALTKSTGGTVTVTAAQTYSGGSTVNGGTLQINSGGGLLDTGAVDISSGAVLALASGVNDTVGAVTLTNGSITGPGTLTSNDTVTGFDVRNGSISAVLAGNAGLSKSTGSTVTLSAANTYSGGTTISDGTLQINSGGGLRDDGAVNINGGAAVLALASGVNDTVGAVTLTNGSINGPGTLTSNDTVTGFDVRNGSISAVLGGDAGLSKSTGSTVTLSAANTYSGGTTISDGTLQINSGGGLRDDGAVNINGGAAVLALASGVNDTVGAVTLTNGSINGPGTLTSNDTVTGFDVRNGSISAVLAGSGRLTKTAAGGVNTVTISVAQAYTGGTTISDGTLQINSGGGLRDDGAVNVNGGTAVLALASGVNDTVGAVTLTNGSINGPGTLTSNDTVTGFDVRNGSIGAVLAGNAGLSKSTGGTVTLSKANTYGGGTTISNGVLQINSGGGLRDDRAVSINGNTAVLALASGVNDTVGAVTLIDGSISGPGTLTSNDTVTGFNVRNGSISAVLAGNAALDKTTTGTVTITIAQTYSGGTTVNDGTLRVSGSGNLSGGAVSLASTSAELDIVGATVGNTLTSNGGVLSSSTGGGTYSGTATLSANTTVRSGDAATGLTVSGNLGGAGGLVKDGSGRVTLSGTNNYGGSTLVSDGTLRIGSAAALPSGTALTLNGAGATLDLNGNSVTAASLSLTNGTLTGGTLTAGSYAVQAGTLAATLAGSGALTKSTGGTVTVTAAQTYSGGSTVNGGTLQINSGGGLSNAGSITIDGSGAVLGLGTGANDLVGAVTLINGSINGPGTLTSNDTVTGFDVRNGSISAVLAGSAGLTKTTGGTVTLGAANTYSGGTTVSNGLLQINSGGGLLDTGAVIINGSTAALALASGVNDQVGAVTLTNGSITGPGTLTSNNSPTGFDLRNGSVSAVLAGSAGLTKTTTGTVTLSAANAYTGTTAVNAGTLQLDGSAARAGQGAATLAATGTLELRNGAVLANPTLASAGGTLAASAGSGRIDSATTLTGTTTLQVASGASLQLQGAVAGAGGLRKSGQGAAVLSTTNSFAGDVALDEGTLQLSGTAATAGTGQLALAAGAALDLAGGPTLTNASLVSQGGTVSSGTGGGSIQSPITLAASTTFSVGDVANGLSLNGAVDGAASADLVKAGAGRLTLAADNRYAGATLVNVGTLATQGDERLPDATALQLQAGSTLVLGGSETIGLLRGSGSAQLGGFQLATGTAGDSSFSGSLAGTAGSQLSKQGNSRFSLQGTVDVARLAVQQGTLVLDGAADQAATAALQVARAGIVELQGDKTVADLQLAGQLLPGTTGATLSTPGTYALQDGAVVQANLGAGSLTSDGATQLQGLSAASNVAVQTGTLTLTGANRLASTAQVQVLAGATLSLADAQALGQLALSGSVSGGGLLMADLAALSGGSVFTPLNVASLTSQGTSLIGAAVAASGTAQLQSGLLTLDGGTLAAPVIDVAGGTLATTSAGRLSTAELQVRSGAALQLAGAESVTGLLVQGRVDGPGSLAATEAVMDGGSLNAALRTTTLRSTGGGTLAAAVQAGSTSATGGSLLVDTAGTLQSPTIAVQGGELRTATANRLLGGTQLSLGNGARLTLGGDQTLTRLADAAGTDGSALLTLVSGALTVGDASDATFSGRISGDGGLTKQGAGTFTLASAADNDFTGATRVLAGTLSIARDGLLGRAPASATAGQLLLDGGTLRVTASTELAASRGLALQGAGGTLEVADGQTLTYNGVAADGAGSGRLTKTGGGTLSLGGANIYSGSTAVQAGRLRTAGNERLPDATALTIASGATLELGGAETLQSLDAQGTASLAGSVTTQGDQRYAAPVTVVATTPIRLTAGGALSATAAGNDWNTSATQPLSIDAASVQLSTLQASGGTHADLVLGDLRVTAGESRIDAGLLTLAATWSLEGSAQLALVSHATPTYTAADVAPGVVDPDGRVLHVASDVITQSTGSRITTADGSGLLLVSVAGGSIRLGQEANDFGGHVAALSSNGATLTPTSFGSAWTANVEGGGVGAALPARQSVITLAGQNLRIGSQSLALEGGGSLAVNGVAGDLVRLTAGTLRTDPGSLIRARLWYNDAAFGTIRSTPGLQLTLLDPLAYASNGTFGNSDAPIAAEVGAITADAPRAGLSAGFVQVLPKNGARGSTAIYLTGPRIAAGLYSFFHDGAGQLSEVPVLYNGFLPASPQLSGSLSSVASVSEQARKERFEEAVRTENVAVRLRAGVIAEVGPGRPATQGSDGIRLPEQCEPSWPALDCAK